MSHECVMYGIQKKILFTMQWILGHTAEDIGIEMAYNETHIRNILFSIIINEVVELIYNFSSITP